MPLGHLRCFGGSSAICLLLCFPQKSGGAVHPSSMGQPQHCHGGFASGRALPWGTTGSDVALFPQAPRR